MVSSHPLWVEGQLLFQAKASRFSTPAPPTYRSWGCYIRAQAWSCLFLSGQPLASSPCNLRAVGGCHKRKSVVLGFVVPGTLPGHFLVTYLHHPCLTPSPGEGDCSHSFLRGTFTGCLHVQPRRIGLPKLPQNLTTSSENGALLQQ